MMGMDNNIPKDIADTDNGINKSIINDIGIILYMIVKNQVNINNFVKTILPQK